MYSYLPIAESLFTIHIVYSKKLITGSFKICDAITKNTQKSSGLFLFLWYPVVLEKYKDAMTELSCLSECEGFINGFRLGVRLMAESFYGRE